MLSWLRRLQRSFELGEGDALIEADALREGSDLGASIDALRDVREVAVFKRVEMPKRNFCLARDLLKREPAAFASLQRSVPPGPTQTRPSASVGTRTAPSRPTAGEAPS